MFGSGTVASIIANEEMNDAMKLIKLLEEFVLFIKGVRQPIKTEAK